MTKELDQDGICVILPASGKGLRFETSSNCESGSCLNGKLGVIPKQFIPVGKELVPLFIRSLNGFCKILWIRTVVLLVPEDYFEFTKSAVSVHGCQEVRSKLVLLIGAETRHRTIKRGVEELRKTRNSIIIIHDAVRPFVDERTCFEVVKEAAKHGACGVYTPLVSTIIRLNGEGFMEEALPRQELYASEMPQAFEWVNLLVAYDNATDHELDFGTECLALVKKYSNCIVKMLEVDPNRYFKVTYEKDLAYINADFGNSAMITGEIKNNSSNNFIRENRQLDSFHRVDYP